MNYKDVNKYLNRDKMRLREIARNTDYAEEAKLIAHYLRAINETMEIVDELGRKRDK